MDKCIYKDKVLTASEIANNFIDEQEIRKLGRLSLLQCYNTDCNANVIYKRGEIRGPHFAHKDSNIDCLYNKFSIKKERNTSKETKDFKELLFNYLNQQYNVIKDYKIFNGHWCDLYINDSNKQVAIEIISEYITPSYYDRLIDKYKQKGQIVIWIIISRNINYEKDIDMYHCKRSQLENGLLIMWNHIKNKFIVYKSHTKNSKKELFTLEFNLNTFTPLYEEIFINLNKKFIELIDDNEKYDKEDRLQNLNEKDYFEVNKNLYPLSENTIILLLKDYFHNINRVEVSKTLKTGYFNCTNTKDNINRVISRIEKKEIPNINLFALLYQFNWLKENDK